MTTSLNTILSAPSGDFWFQDMKTDWYPSEDEDKASTDRVALLIRQEERRYVTKTDVGVVYPLPKKIKTNLVNELKELD